MEDRILTLHPEGKQGVNISREKYDSMKEAIIDCLSREAELTFTQLAAAVEERLARKFEGSISWYCVTVKLDLEARHVLERTSSSPQLIRLVNDVQG